MHTHTHRLRERPQYRKIACSVSIIAIESSMSLFGNSVSEATKEELNARCAALRHKCVLLRQIHSMRMNKAERWDRVLNVGTVIVAALATFVGFFGTPKITHLVSLLYPASEDSVELAYNAIVFLVLLLSILNISFQFKEMGYRHWRAINILTDFVTDLDGITCVARHSDEELRKNMAFINYRYKHVVDILPPSSDADYLRAKKALAEKQ